jgi:hypothetical protein
MLKETLSRRTIGERYIYFKIPNIRAIYKFYGAQSKGILFGGDNAVALHPVQPFYLIDREDMMVVEEMRSAWPDAHICKEHRESIRPRYSRQQQGASEGQNLGRLAGAKFPPLTGNLKQDKYAFARKLKLEFFPSTNARMLFLHAADDADEIRAFQIDKRLTKRSRWNEAVRKGVRRNAHNIRRPFHLPVLKAVVEDKHGVAGNKIAQVAGTLASAGTYPEPRLRQGLVKQGGLVANLAPRDGLAGFTNYHFLASPAITSAEKGHKIPLFHQLPGNEEAHGGFPGTARMNATHADHRSPDFLRKRGNVVVKEVPERHHALVGRRQNTWQRSIAKRSQSDFMCDIHQELSC